MESQRTTGSASGHGGPSNGNSVAMGGHGSVTTISNCDTETSMDERDERESSPPPVAAAAAGGGDMLSNSIHGLMNVGTFLNPFSTSQKN